MNEIIHFEDFGVRVTNQVVNIRDNDPIPLQSITEVTRTSQRKYRGIAGSAVVALWIILTFHSIAGFIFFLLFAGVAFGIYKLGMHRNEIMLVWSQDESGNVRFARYELNGWTANQTVDEIVSMIDFAREEVAHEV